jgi:hypothetical protein
MILPKLYVRNSKGESIPVSAVVNLVEKQAARQPCIILTGTRQLLSLLHLLMVKTVGDGGKSYAGNRAKITG